MEIKPCDLILVRGVGIISEAIEAVERSPYSHVAGVIKDNELIEAEGFKKVGYQSLDVYAGIADIFTCGGLTFSQRLAIKAYVKNEIGYRYDYLLLTWELIRYTLHLSLPFKEPYHSRVCSTLWVDAYKKVAGIDLCPGIIYPSPGDLGQSKLLRKLGSL